MVAVNFDVDNTPTNDTFEPIPVGWYKCVIVDSEEKQSSSGPTYVKLTLQVIEGAYAGRKVWDNLNINNHNEIAREIARKQLSTYRKVTGVRQLRDTAQLHNIPFAAYLGIQEDKSGNYAPQNRVQRLNTVNVPAQSPHTARQSNAEQGLQQNPGQFQDSELPAWAKEFSFSAPSAPPAEGTPARVPPGAPSWMNTPPPGEDGAEQPDMQPAADDTPPWLK